MEHPPSRLARPMGGLGAKHPLLRLAGWQPRVAEMMNAFLSPQRPTPTEAFRSSPGRSADPEPNLRCTFNLIALADLLCANTFLKMDTLSELLRARGRGFFAWRPKAGSADRPYRHQASSPVQKISS